MDYYNFEDLVSSLASGFTINENRKYWFVRTVGGTYYSHFLNGGYVAIDYSDISKKFLDELPEKEESALISLKTAYKDRHPNAKNAGKHAAQLYRFYRGIKEGDVVIIPSPDSNELSFGIVKGAMYEQRLISDTDAHL